MRANAKTNAKGSERWIRRMINEFSSEFSEKIQMQSNIEIGGSIDWRSPLSQDNLAEYRDQDFLGLPDLTPAKRSLKAFWPVPGPQWDTLGSTEKGEPLIIEAKGNLGELVSPPSQASPKSMVL